jgi:hypothetical protein
VKVLQQILGHASAALTLDRYGHLMPGQAESIADRLDAMARAREAAPLSRGGRPACDCPRSLAVTAYCPPRYRAASIARTSVGTSFSAIDHTWSASTR